MQLTDDEIELDAALLVAIRAVMSEAKAVAQSAHDRAHHHGYYRAVKSLRAAKAAISVREKTTTNAIRKARFLPKELVFKKIVEHTKLGSGTTLVQLLQELERKVKSYVEKVQANYDDYPQISGLHAFLEQMQTLQKQIISRRDQPFDSEVMVTLMLWVISVTNKAVYFQFVIEHEVHSLERALQQGNKQEMPIKMKSEIGLHGFFEYITALERILKRNEQYKAMVQVMNGLKSELVNRQLLDPKGTLDSDGSP